MAAIRNFCAGLIALVARLYEVEISEIRFNYPRRATYMDGTLHTDL